MLAVRLIHILKFNYIQNFLNPDTIKENNKKVGLVNYILDSYLRIDLWRILSILLFADFAIWEGDSL